VSRSAGTVLFDERFQAREGVVPLRGYLVKIVADLLHRLGVKLEEAFAAGADAAYDADTLEDTKMLGDRLTREARTPGELRDGVSPTARELCEQR
jgi:hypothetical protein